MSSNLSALLSATFYEAGDEHRVELVHQQDRKARRQLASLDLAVYDPEGKHLVAVPMDTHQEILDLGALVGSVAGALPRVMVLLDARYDERIFPGPSSRWSSPPSTPVSICSVSRSRRSSAWPATSSDAAPTRASSCCSIISSRITGDPELRRGTRSLARAPRP